MAEFDFVGLSAPISETDPSGPDLDLEGDREYMNFMAKIELLLPASFLSFDRANVDFPAEFTTLRELMARTRDLRLLVVTAKLLILNRDLEGFGEAVGAIRRLLMDQWETVHPRGSEDGFAARMAILQTLDDMPSPVMPLQSAPLLMSRRAGPISFRANALAAGDIKPRDGESFPDRASIEQAVSELPLSDLIQVRDRGVAMLEALKTIRAETVKRVGGENAPALDRITALGANIVSMLDKFVVHRDPSAGLAGPVTQEEPSPNGDGAAAPGAQAAGAVRSPAQARDALACVASYLNRAEPSNPALLLVRQAEQLIGKTFLEVLKVLIPQQLEQAAAQLGRDRYFELPLGTLAGLVNGDTNVDNADMAAAESADSPAEDGADASAGDAPDAPADNGAGAQPRPPTSSTRQIDDRPSAIAILDQVAAFYRQFEPSSPIPLLTDTARNMMNKDFLSILKDILPPETLRGREL